MPEEEEKREIEEGGGEGRETQRSKVVREALPHQSLSLCFHTDPGKQRKAKFPSLTVNG